MGNNKQFEHLVQEKWCKGCNICVALCPKTVLALSGGKVYVENPNDCIGCQLCEMRCPDFAIEVKKEKKSDGGNMKDKYFLVPQEAEAE